MKTRAITAWAQWQPIVDGTYTCSGGRSAAGFDSTLVRIDANVRSVCDRPLVLDECIDSLSNAQVDIVCRDGQMNAPRTAGLGVVVQGSGFGTPLFTVH